MRLSVSIVIIATLWCNVSVYGWLRGRWRRHIADSWIYYNYYNHLHDLESKNTPSISITVLPFSSGNKWDLRNIHNTGETMFAAVEVGVVQEGITSNLMEVDIVLYNRLYCCFAAVFYMLVYSCLLWCVFICYFLCCSPCLVRKTQLDI